jgi:hypothetical protein
LAAIAGNTALNTLKLQETEKQSAQNLSAEATLRINFEKLLALVSAIEKSAQGLERGLKSGLKTLQSDMRRDLSKAVERLNGMEKSTGNFQKEFDSGAKTRSDIQRDLSKALELISATENSLQVIKNNANRGQGGYHRNRRAGDGWRGRTRPRSGGRASTARVRSDSSDDDRYDHYGRQEYPYDYLD